MGAALATPEDFADFIGRPLVDLDEDRIEFLLGIASGLVRDEIGQVIDRLDGDVVELMARAGDVLLLPELPVWDVTAVEERTPAGTAWRTLTEGTDYDLELGYDGREGIVRRRGTRWTHRNRVRVTYDHGYTLSGGTASGGTDLPETIRLVVLRATTRGISNPGGHRSENIGTYAYSNGFSGADAPGLTLSTGDRDELGPFYPGNRAGRR